MTRHGTESLWASINRHKRKKDPNFARFSVRMELKPWRGCVNKTYSLRWCVAQCMFQENVGPWAAWVMVRRWAIICNTWPAPFRKPNGIKRYVSRATRRDSPLKLNLALPRGTSEQ